MRYLLFCTLLILFSCKDHSTTTVNQTTVDSLSSAKFFIPSYAVNKFEGSYSGSFNNGFITIVLNYTAGNNVSGYDIERGLRRNINGTLKPGGDSYDFTLKEPGDNPTDGIFQFSIDTITFALKGIWKPFDTSKIVSKALLLKKQPKKTEDDYNNELGTWVPSNSNYSTDTTLDFSNEGICELRFYRFPGDSTSQMISVKGSYIVDKDTILIEWQKNLYTPLQKMKLVKHKQKVKDADYEEEHLVGNGWKLTKMEGD